MHKSLIFMGGLLILLLAVMIMSHGQTVAPANSPQEIIQRHIHFWQKMKPRTGTIMTTYTIDATSQLPELNSFFSIKGTGLFHDTTKQDTIDFAVQVDAGKKKQAIQATGMIKKHHDTQTTAFQLLNLERAYQEYDSVRELVAQLLEQTTDQWLSLSQKNDPYFLTHSPSFGDFSLINTAIIHALSDTGDSSMSGQLSSRIKKNIGLALTDFSQRTSMMNFFPLESIDHYDNLEYDVVFDKKQKILTLSGLTHPSRDSSLSLSLSSKQGKIHLHDYHKKTTLAREWDRLSHAFSGQLVFHTTNEAVSFVGSLRKRSGATKEEYNYDGQVIIHLQGASFFDKYDGLYYDIQGTHRYTDGHTKDFETISQPLPFYDLLQQLQFTQI